MDLGPFFTHFYSTKMTKYNAILAFYKNI